MLQHLRGHLEDLQVAPRSSARLALPPQGKRLSGPTRDADVETGPMDRGTDPLRPYGRDCGAGFRSPLEIQGRYRRGIYGGRERAQRLAAHHQGDPRRPTARRHGLPRHHQAEPLRLGDLRLHPKGRDQDDASGMYRPRLRLLHPHLPRQPLHRSKGEP